MTKLTRKSGVLRRISGVVRCQPVVRDRVDPKFCDLPYADVQIVNGSRSSHMRLRAQWWPKASLKTG